MLTLTCARCSNSFEARSPVAKYCPACKKQLRLQYTLAWKKNNPKAYAKIQQRYQQKRSAERAKQRRCRDCGVTLNKLRVLYCPACRAKRPAKNYQNFCARHSC